ncbi:unnamed protein product, partial [Urochloa humidicola]
RRLPLPLAVVAPPPPSRRRCFPHPATFLSPPPPSPPSDHPLAVATSPFPATFLSTSPLLGDLPLHPRRPSTAGSLTVVLQPPAPPAAPTTANKEQIPRLRRSTHHGGVPGKQGSAQLPPKMDDSFFDLNFSAYEDNVLCKSWLEISCDPITITGQRRES